MKRLSTWLGKERGRTSALARHLGIFPNSISRWKQVPADRALEVESFTGISRHDLRPDVYGPKPKQGKKHERA